MLVSTNRSFSSLTTFHIGGPAAFFVEAKSLADITEAVAFARDKSLPILVLGGGSNMLVSDRGWEGLALKVAVRGREILEDSADSVLIKIGAGEVLDEVIAWAVENTWSGMENLSFVPGDVGGLVVQNVNAYGQDASKVIASVEAYDTQTNAEIRMTNDECEFGYRRSIFNTTQRDRYVITSVTLRLKKRFEPVIVYPDAQRYFEGRDPATVSMQEMREGIIAIRKAKGQDPQEYWSAGSFFKNILLTDEEFDALLVRVRSDFGDERAGQLLVLKDRFARIEQLYTSVTGMVDTAKAGKIKIPVGFILDGLLQLKNTRVGDAAISEKQVINILNLGKATAHDVMSLFQKTRQAVYAKTGVAITNEPELIGFTEEELLGYFKL